MSIPTSSSRVLDWLNQSNLPPVLRAELVEVYVCLYSPVRGLRYPLNELLSQEIEQAYPFANAGVVLAAAFSERDDEVLRQRRIHLASALEMLRIALSVHYTLLSQSTAALSIHSIDGADVQQMEQNKSLIGSVILVGDYCFSHSAYMAAQTDNPEVVALFAQALKELSEEHLRHAFASKNRDVDRYQMLFRAGVETAARLAGLPAETLSQNLYISRQLAQAIESGPRTEMQSGEQINASPYQYERWQSVFRWLLNSHVQP